MNALKETQQIYKVFDWLRFPLIVGVVFIHSFGTPFDYDALDFLNLSGIDRYNLFRVSISKVLTHVCVPTFYFISGFLFFKGLETWDVEKYKQKPFTWLEQTNFRQCQAHCSRMVHSSSIFLTQS